MHRTIQKHIMMNSNEAEELRKKAKLTCLTEAALIRLLIKGYEPREKPDEEFYSYMREMSLIYLHNEDVSFQKRVNQKNT